ncbi:hypothetical protein BB559_001279 [Furculomyces boomerangus]|uniref:Prefoldin subunit 2 n=2 Tax=Harpellales TaxID=61421 RepID=A0A2T9Z2L0_9FUNG|nr:hypothetical protein BB559_001279 [Furculomyces boomerangus]PWA01172.1 hypothetical protein BB558_002762 [Smittium angustum]
MSQNDIVKEFNAYKQELQGLASKAGELEMEIEEHKLVIDTIKPMEPERTCFRLINGVLVERTVKEVLPALEANLEGISKIISVIMEQYKKKETEFIEFQKKNKIRDGQINQS